MDEKLYCHVCKEFKETSQFSPCKKAKLRNGKSYVCKQCQALAQRQRREKQKDIDLLDFTLKKRLYDAQNRAKSKNQYYDKDNIWLICSAVNFMKSNLNLEEFKQYCQAVINYKK